MPTVIDTPLGVPAGYTRLGKGMGGADLYRGPDGQVWLANEDESGRITSMALNSEEVAGTSARILREEQERANYRQQNRGAYDAYQAWVQSGAGGEGPGLGPPMVEPQGQRQPGVQGGWSDYSDEVLQLALEQLPQLAEALPNEVLDRWSNEWFIAHPQYQYALSAAHRATFSPGVLGSPQPTPVAPGGTPGISPAPGIAPPPAGGAPPAAVASVPTQGFGWNDPTKPIEQQWWYLHPQIGPDGLQIWYGYGPEGVLSNGATADPTKWRKPTWQELVVATKANLTPNLKRILEQGGSPRPGAQQGVRQPTYASLGNVPMISSRDLNSLAPSEREMLGVTVNRTGGRADDYFKEQEKLYAAPRIIPTRTRIPRTPGLG